MPPEADTDGSPTEMPDAPPANDTNGSSTNPPDLPASPEQQPSPIIPGPRAARLQDVYARTLKHTLNKLGWDNFAGCYPTIALRAEGVLRQVQTQMVEKLGDKCEKEFDNIMTARQVVPKLNELEALVSDASRRRSANKTTAEPTPPHLLPPHEILSAHLHPSLTAHQSLLNARLQTTQAQNALLHDEVRRQRDEIAELLAELETTVGDVRGANAALAPVVAELAEESRVADVDMPERS